MMGDARVLQVRETAVAGEFALVGGYSAWFLHRVLESVPGGLQTVLARSGVPPERRADVLRAYAALGHVGAVWRLDHVASERESIASDDAGQTSGSVLRSRDVANILGITDRRVRALAGLGQLNGRRNSDGRWVFSAVDIEVEREKRAIRGE